jgi:hypothetical protein
MNFINKNCTFFFHFTSISFSKFLCISYQIFNWIILKCFIWISKRETIFNEVLDKLSDDVHSIVINEFLQPAQIKVSRCKPSCGLQNGTKCKFHISHRHDMSLLFFFWNYFRTRHLLESWPDSRVIWAVPIKMGSLSVLVFKSKSCREKPLKLHFLHRHNLEHSKYRNWTWAKGWVTSLRQLGERGYLLSRTLSYQNVLLTTWVYWSRLCNSTSKGSALSTVYLHQCNNMQCHYVTSVRIQ